ncbi:MAG TPA: hypothetical protein VGK46_02505 [Saprospiraceae bacterium]
MSNFNMKDGRAEVVLVSDSILNDSSMITGRIYDLNYGDQDYPVQAAKVWLNNSSLTTVPGATGYFHIKVLPGTYTVMCERDFNEWPELVEKVRDIRIQKNQKVVLHFYLGYVAE